MMPRLDIHDILMTKHYQYMSSLKATLNGFKIIKASNSNLVWTGNRHPKKPRLSIGIPERCPPDPAVFIMVTIL